MHELSEDKHLFEILENWHLRQGYLEFYEFEKYGSKGIKIICQYGVSIFKKGGSISSFGRLLTEIGTYYGLNENFVEGIIEAAQDKSPEFDSFMHKALQYSPSISSAIINYSSSKIDDPNIVRITLRIFKLCRYVGIGNWKVAEKISDYLVKIITCSESNLNKEAIECAFILLFPCSIPGLLELFENIIENKLACDIKPAILLSLIIHTLAWPCNPYNYGNKNILPLIEKLSQKASSYPVINLLTSLIQKEITKGNINIEEGLSPDWISEQTEFISGPSSKNILKDANEKKYQQLYSYIDRAVSQNIFSFELYNFIRLAICEGMGFQNISNRRSISDFLGEMDTYYFTKYTHANPIMEIDVDLQKKVNTLIKNLAGYLLIYNQIPKNFNSKEIINSMPELKTPAAVKILDREIDNLKGDILMKTLLIEVRNEIINQL